jgi:iron complex transport system substrate-binding protein
VAARPGWSGTTAVKSRHVIMLNDDIASRWGPRVVNLLRTVLAAIKGS